MYRNPLLLTITLLLLAAPAQGNDQLIWNFDTRESSITGTHRCDVTFQDGVMQGEIDGNGYFFLPAFEIKGPLTLRFRMKTDGNLFGRGELYWSTENAPDMGFSRFMRFMPNHDNEWHEYEVALPETGTMTALRFSPGWKDGRFWIDWMSLTREDWPDEVRSQHESLPSHLRLESPELALRIDTAPHCFELIDKATGRHWTADATETKALLVEAEKTDPGAANLTFYDHSTQSTYFCTVTLAERSLAFELGAQAPDKPFYSLNNYPPAFACASDQAKLVWCSRSSGLYVDQDDPTFRNNLLSVWGNTSCTDMPWVGWVDPLNGDGLMTLIETGADAFVQLIADADGRSWPQVIWRVSMDSFRYPRRISYRFSPEGGYVSLADVYREYAAQEGRLVTLEQKAAERPVVNRLKGAPIIWGAVDSWDWVREARTWGILKGVISNAHHCLNDDGSLRKLNELGYITSEYENVVDIREGAVAFGLDDVDKTAYHERPGSGPKGGWVTEEGWGHSSRSSAYGLAAMKTYVPDVLDRYGFNGRFVDVSMALDLEEDHHPDHTFDRRQDMAYRRGFHEYLLDFGLVLGTEHGNDWGIDLADYFEGSLSGPFWWQGGTDWNAGMLLKPRDRDDYTEKYLKYGNGYQTRIPLWQLVYNDCAVSTWYWGDSPGFHYDIAPDIAERKHLFTMLYGASTLVWRDWRGYDWNTNPWALARAIHLTAHLQEKVAFGRMLDHGFVSDDLALQRTRFDSGHTVVVNFSSEPRIYQDDVRGDITLAGEGFWVDGPDIVQQKLQTEDGPALRIETDGFLWHNVPGFRQIGPVASTGDFLAFRVEDRWQIVAQDGPFALNLAGLTGWEPDSSYLLVELDDTGRRKRVLQRLNGTNDLVHDMPDASAFLAVENTPQTPELIIYPPSGMKPVSEPVLLSCTHPDAELRYTLDGSTPTLASPLADGPLPIQGTAALRTRAFVDAEAVTPVMDREYTGVEKLYDSGLLKYGQEAQKVEIPLAGFDALRVVVTLGGDDCWADYADMAEPVLVMANGTRTRLTTIEPTVAQQTVGDLRVVQPGDAQEMRIAGRDFEHGIGTHAEAELIFPLDREYERLITWIGVDDMATPPTERTPRATLEMVFYGITR